MPHCSGWRWTRDHLAELFYEVGYTVGAEIGVRYGRYSKIMCQKNPNLLLYCIDGWHPYDGGKYHKNKQDRIYSRAVKTLQPFNTKIIRKKSLDALGDIEDESLDFVYIDADHTFDAAMMDIICWSAKVRSNGIVAVHDYYSGEKGVMNAVDAYTHSHRILPWYVTKELSPTAYWVKV